MILNPGRLMAMPIYPNVNTEIIRYQDEGKNLVEVRMASRIRRKSPDGLWRYCRHYRSNIVKDKDFEKHLPMIIESFHMSIYLEIQLGEINPELKADSGEFLYPICEEQIDEKERLKKLLKNTNND